jgi:Mg2+ and Co2+ transporter CorA
VNDFEDIAELISAAEARLSDVIFNTVRSQMRGDNAEEAKELEKRLSKARRSLQKAEHLLRGASELDD